ncbi:MAG: hypothetical protein ABGY09_06500 [Euryarchaeota archaeon]
MPPLAGLVAIREGLGLCLRAVNLALRGIPFEGPLGVPEGVAGDATRVLNELDELMTTVREGEEPGFTTVLGLSRRARSVVGRLESLLPGAVVGGLAWRVTR